MSIVIMVLWMMGLAFLAVLWIGVAASILRLARATGFDRRGSGHRGERSPGRAAPLRRWVGAPHA